MKIENFSEELVLCQIYQHQQEDDISCLTKICNFILSLFKSLFCCFFSESQSSIDPSRVSQLPSEGFSKELTYEQTKGKVRDGELPLKEAKEEWQDQIAQELVDQVSKDNSGNVSVSMFRALFAAWKSLDNQELKLLCADRAVEMFKQAQDMEELLKYIPSEAFSQGPLDKEDPKLLNICIDYVVKNLSAIVENKVNGKATNLHECKKFFPELVKAVVDEYQEKQLRIRGVVSRATEMISLLSEFRIKIIDCSFKAQNPELGTFYDQLLKGIMRFDQLSNDDGNAIRAHILDAAKIHQDVEAMIQFSEKLEDEQLTESLKKLAQEIFNNCQSYVDFCAAKISSSAFNKDWLDRGDKKILRFCADYVKDRANFCIETSYDILNKGAWPPLHHSLFMFPLIPESMWKVIKKYSETSAKSLHLVASPEKIQGFKTEIEAVVSEALKV